MLVRCPWCYSVPDGKYKCTMPFGLGGIYHDEHPRKDTDPGYVDLDNLIEQIVKALGKDAFSDEEDN